MMSPGKQGIFDTLKAPGVELRCITEALQPGYHKCDSLPLRYLNMTIS